MLPFVTYEMVRQRNEERVATSVRKHWLRHARSEAPELVAPAERNADVIELVFGTRCGVEDAIA